MGALLVFVVYGLLLAAMFFAADTLVGLYRQWRGIDDRAVDRRLARTALHRESAGSSLELLRSDAQSGQARHSLFPLADWLNRLMRQSGLDYSLQSMIVTAAVLTFLSFAVLVALLPLQAVALSVALAVALGMGGPLLFVAQARARRRARFEEQMPDAIDLMVRSLRVGHPLSSTFAVIAKEMPQPIAGEFEIAYNEIAYGQDVPSAVAAIAQRVGAPDLGYLTVAIQIQQETGGNLAESLTKLSAVIRERFRMFRKVKALTAEGRFSAWLLSILPIGIAFVLQIVKPDYYSQVANFPYFTDLAIATLLMLVINLIAMRMITNIKV